MFTQKSLKIHSIPSFRFGLNTQQSPDEIQDFELSDCENWSVEEDSITTAPGYSAWDDDAQSHPGPYWGGFSLKKTDGTVVDVRQRQNVLEYASSGGYTWTQCTLPVIGSPAATVSLAQIPCTFAALNDTLVWTNGTDSVMSSTDGITWTIPTTGSPAEELPKSRVVFNNGKNRLLFLAQSANPYRFDWTDINAPTTISASSFQLVDPNSNGIVLGAGKTPDGTTLIFKEAALYAVSDFVDNGIVDINFIGQTKLSSHQTIQTTENSVIWCAYDGLQELIAGQIRDIFGRISPLGRNTVLRQDLFCSVYYNHKYHLSMPDATISSDYNSQEYIIYKTMQRDDPVQPYVITRNKRYFGCYWIADIEYAGIGRSITAMYGDSRTSEGSPAEVVAPCGWINDYRTTTLAGFAVDQGLGGESQTCYFVTKYFTEDAPFFIKRFKKMFANFKVTQDMNVTISYRFLPYGSWTDVAESLTAEELEVTYDDGDTGTFLEGYGFSLDTLGQIFIDIENTEKPRGIQFKVSATTISDIQLYSMAYNFKTKVKFK